MVQFDSLGRPAFLHRTLNKFWAGAEAWPLERLTGPLPARWVEYYLSHDSLGPTVGVPYDYVVPDSALVHWHVNAPLEWAAAAGEEEEDAAAAAGDGKWGERGRKRRVATRWEVGPQEGCPLATFVDYRRAREAGLPLGPAPGLDARCAPLLPTLVGPKRWPQYRDAGFAADPELLHVAASDFDAAASERVADNALIPRQEVGDGTPVAAWAPDYNSSAWPGPPRKGVALETSGVAALRAQYEAFEWLKARVDEFPVIRDGP